MDWRAITNDPAHDKVVRAKYLEWILSRRKILNINLLDFFVKVARNKSVLDIGVVEHDESHMRHQDWKHGHIVNASKRCVGIDIIEPLVKTLNDRGFNVICVDATGNSDLGERFETIVVGDVIEHVNDPVALVRFCARHLKDSSSRIYISTPNPFFETWRKMLRKDGTFIANFEHTSWITPTNMVEIASRAGCSLVNYYVPELGIPRYNLVKRWWILRKPIELRAGFFVYEVANA
jgi:2-polyprenyl-3-methyl-5-hydroxy-6-metoxy-1,4-benzoquinol methylase